MREKARKVDPEKIGEVVKKKKAGREEIPVLLSE